jgi:hypothetical protein
MITIEQLKKGTKVIPIAKHIGNKNYNWTFQNAKGYRSFLYVRRLVLSENEFLPLPYWILDELKNLSFDFPLIECGVYPQKGASEYFTLDSLELYSDINERNFHGAGILEADSNVQF